jgi:hypothetical protein
MNPDAEHYLLSLYINAGYYNPVQIIHHLDYICKTYNVVDKQIYASLEKFNKKGILNYGTSINCCWLEKLP